MTETEWLSCKNPQSMLLFVQDQDEQKRRLFACACCRRIWDLLDSEEHQLAVEVAEKFAKGLASDEERSAVAYLVDGADDEPAESPQELARVAASWAIQSDEECEDVLDPDTEDFAILTARAAADATGNPEREAEAQCQLLREIFGNPFRT